LLKRDKPSPNRDDGKAQASLSPFVLDLKQNKGELMGFLMDLPLQLPERKLEPVYTRKQEQLFLPRSYRTGLAFFGAVMVMTMTVMTGVQASQQAEQKQVQLNHDIFASFQALQQEVSLFTQKKSPTGLLSWDAAEDFEMKADEGFSWSQQQVEAYHALQRRHGDQQLIELGLELTKGYQDFKELVTSWEEAGNKTLLERLASMKTASSKATYHWQSALDLAHGLSFDSFSNAQRLVVFEHLTKIESLLSILNAFEQFYDPLENLLGSDEPRRMLVLIQDSSEQRGTGGALSAGIEILVDSGKVLSWKPFHAEDYDQKLTVDLTPPHPFDAITKRWGLLTANTSLNTPQSADKIHWFWQREARSSVDVIALIDIKLFERLFGLEDIKGSLVRLKDRQIENVSLQWSALRLADRREELKSLADLLLDALLTLAADPQLVLPHWDEMAQLFAEKQIVLYSPDRFLQSFFEKQAVSGSLPSLVTGQDLLMVGRLNLGSNATDRWIHESRSLHTAIDESGTIRHWLEITRLHRGNEASAIELVNQVGVQSSQGVLKKLRTAVNSSLTRVIVPKGSELISSTGIELTQISHDQTEEQTVWSWRTDLAAGNTEVISITYELPWTFNLSDVDNYRLHLIKQSGSPTVAFEHYFKTPKGLTVFQQLPEEPIVDLAVDRQIAIVAGR